MKLLVFHRRTARFLIVFGLGCNLTACQQSLDEQVFSFISTQNFYKTAVDAEAAVYAAYQPFNSDDYYRQNYFNTCALPDDQVTIGRNPTFQAMDLWSFAADHPYPTQLWRALYQGVNRANTVLDRVPAIDMDAARKATLLAEASFIRAYNYFVLVRLFGNVPLTTTEVNGIAQTNVARATKDKVYELIISDLKAAESNLPLTRPGSEFGRVTKGAAQTALAEVYLTLERWPEAAAKAAEVIASKQYQLQADFSSVFSVTNEANSEIIFSIQFDGTNVGNVLASFSQAGGTDNPNCANGVQVWSVDTQSEMWKNWDPADSRRTVSVYDKFTNRKGQVIDVLKTARPFPAFGKYNAPGESSQGNSPVNPIVYRYAEVLLIFAEATSQANGGPIPAAYDAVNQVRRRAYRRPLTTPAADDLPANLSAQAFRTAVIRERSLEFVLEIKRIYDLMRTNQFPDILTTIGKPINAKAKLFPIPKSELDANDALTDSDQNPGY